MRHFVVVAFVALLSRPSVSQQATPTPPPPASVAAAPSAPPTSEQLALARKLVDSADARRAMVEGMRVSLPQAIEPLRKAMPDADPKFFDEWSKRMMDRFPFDKLIDAIVQAYAESFTTEELKQLGDLVASRAAGSPIAPSQELMAKVQAMQPTLQAKAAYAGTELGAQLGGNIQEELMKEHPEWLHAAAAPAAH